MTGVSVACPAKVNLFLRILAREDTGYHQIETLYQAVGLFDRVDVRRRGRQGILLEVLSDPAARESRNVIGDLGGPEHNTVTRAARAFFSRTGITPAVSLVLAKAIPAGTGLGGGSSDAAGALAALNLLHGEPLSREDLIETGGRIGADVPFFCARVPTALGWGRGDRLLTCAPPPAAHAVLAISRDRVSTAAAYREASARLDLPAPPRLVDGPGVPSWDRIAALQANDFEGAVFHRLPRLREVRDTLLKHGAVVARLTGSGSAVFGIFGDERDADVAAGRLRRIAGIDAALTVPTLTAIPDPVPIPGATDGPPTA